MRETRTKSRDSEVWYQDPEDPKLWHGRHGVIVNTEALNEREFFYDIIRVAARAAYNQERPVDLSVPDQTLPNAYPQ